MSTSDGRHFFEKVYGKINRSLRWYVGKNPSEELPHKVNIGSMCSWGSPIQESPRGSAIERT